MTRVAVATTSQLAADGAREVAELGGNAVDCALAAALTTMNTEPGVCALAGSAFVTDLASRRRPGHDRRQCRGPRPRRRRRGARPCSAQRHARLRRWHHDARGPGLGIGTRFARRNRQAPGDCYGSARWKDLFVPVIRATREGFPLSSACHYYLGYSGKAIFGRSGDGYRALHDANDVRRAAGSSIVVPHLADTLTTIAEEGARVFYQGRHRARNCEPCHRAMAAH